MKRKKNDLHTLAALDWQEYVEAPTVKEVCPKASSLTIDSVLYDDSGVRIVRTDSQSYEGAAKFLFKIKCANYECVAGGFNLTHMVRYVLANNLDKKEEKIICQGWQDRERVGKYHCLCELHYNISVVYK